jgi:hypothetical protein
MRHAKARWWSRAPGADEIRAEANALIVQTMINRMTEIVLSGFYLDRIVRSGGRFLFKERLRIRLPATAYLPDRARIRRVTWAVRTTPHGVSTRPFIGDTVACLDRDR